MTARYIGILKQGDLFRAYWREGEKDAWKPIRLEGEEESPWSIDSFKDIFRYLQIDAATSALGILVISDKEESIAFPAAQEALSFSYEALRDFCRKYAACATHWICQGQALDEALCQKVGFPMDEVGGNQYILSATELTGCLEDLQVPEVVEEGPVEEAVASEEAQEEAEPISPPPVLMTEKQRRHDAYFREMVNGVIENPLTEWKKDTSESL